MFSGRSSGIRSTARRVRSSARVKSSANQPVRLVAVDLLGGAAAGELGPGGDVGGERQLALVADDEDAVPADHDVGLDQLGAEVDRQLVAGGGVLRAVGRGAAVADDHGLGKAGRRSHCQRLGRAHVPHDT